MQHKSLPGRFDWESSGHGGPPLNKLSKQMLSSSKIVLPRPVKAASLCFESPQKRVPVRQLPYSGLIPSKNTSDYNYSEDDCRGMMSSSLPNDNNSYVQQKVLCAGRLEGQGHRRSLSNQTISIRNEGQNNEIVLKSSMSDHNLIFQNNNYSDGTGQYHQSMFYTRNQMGANSNILVSNETIGMGENRVNSTRIETHNGDDNNSMICLKNASTALGNRATHSSVFYKRSRNAALPKIPTVTNYKERVASGITAQQPLHSPHPSAWVPVRAGSSASLDGFQQEGITTTPRTAFGRGQPKYVNEVLLPRGAPPTCPSSSNAAGACNLSRQSVPSPFPRELRGRNAATTRSFEPIVLADGAQDLVEYDSDTGWKRRSMPINILSSLAFEEPIRKDLPPISKVSAETEVRDKDSRNLIESTPKAVASSFANYPSDYSAYCNKKATTAPRGPVGERKENFVCKRSDSMKRRRRKSQSDEVFAENTAAWDLNFPEYVGKIKKSGATNKVQMEDPRRPKDAHTSSDSIKNIIDEVRSELMAHKNSDMSDESPCRDKISKKSSNRKEKTRTKKQLRGDRDSCQSEYEDGSDDVFTSPFMKGRHASFSANDKKIVYPKRRTSSLEDLAKFQKRVAKCPSRCKSAERVSRRKTSSSVSINETPQVYTYEDSGSFKLLRSIARHPVTNSNTSLPNALLNTKPARGSLKQTALTTSKTPQKPISKPIGKPAKKPQKNPAKTSSDYDPRDRRRDGNGNERDMYRYRDRGDREKDLSDREQKDSQNDSFNRSLSNNEGTPDDKIGKCW